MAFSILTPYAPDEAIKRIMKCLDLIDAKVQKVTPRSIRIRLKSGLLSSISIQIDLAETPFGSIASFITPDIFHERLVDETFFGEAVASSSESEKLERAKSAINELKASIDGLTEHEAKKAISLRTTATYLTKCPNCSSTARKGFRCSYCNTIMVKFE